MTADEVKALPQRQLRRAAGRLQLKSAASTPTLAYGLTYGVDLLPEHPVEAARAGRIAKIPLIIGTNSHEASMFAWTKPPMLPTTTASINAYIDRVAPGERERLLAAYPDYPRRRDLLAFGSDVMFGAPTWAFADAYCAHAPTHMYRFDHFGFSLRLLGLGATHGSEIVHIQHSYGSFLGRKMHPLGRRLAPSVGRRMQRAWLDFSAQGWRTGEIEWSSGQDWPIYDAERRLTRIIQSSRDTVVSDPDGGRRRGLGRSVLGCRRVALLGVVAKVVEELLEQPRHHRSPGGHPDARRDTVRLHRHHPGQVAAVGGGLDPVVLGERGDASRRGFVEPKSHVRVRLPGEVLLVADDAAAHVDDPWWCRRRAARGSSTSPW